MFELLEVKGTLKVSSGDYVDIPHTTLTIDKLPIQYNDIYLYIKSESNIFGLPFNNIPIEVRQREIYLSDYVTSITEDTVPNIDVVPKEARSRKLRYFSAWPYIAKTKVGNLEYHQDIPLTEDELHDLWFQTTEPLANFKQNALFTVGGVIHNVDYNSEWGVILGAARTLHQMRVNSIGILDFSELGGLEIVDITDLNLSKLAETDRYVSGSYITLDEDLGHRTPYLVLGGKLHYKGDVLKVVGDRRLKINLSGLDLVREYHALEERTISRLNVRVGTDGQLINDSLREDAYVESLLKSDFSFIILVNSDGHSRDLVALGNTGLPGVYKSVTPNLPVVYGNGFLADYSVDQIDAKGLAVRTYGYMNSNTIRLTGDPSRDTVSVQQNHPAKPANFSYASQLHITKQVLE